MTQFHANRLDLGQACGALAVVARPWRRPFSRRAMSRSPLIRPSIFLMS